MAATDAQSHSKPVPIAPAPAGLSANGGAPQPAMAYTCLACARRKVKCDKAIPICSRCHKGKLECSYQAPQPRRPKRKLSGDVIEKLARYERILRQNGLLPQDDEVSRSTEGTLREPISLRWMEPGTSKTGKLLAGLGKSRYIDSNLWRNLGDDAIQYMTDEEEEDQAVDGSFGDFGTDPFSGAFMGIQQNLLAYHPTQAEASILWKTHVEDVEPICKVLHVPSTSKMIDLVSKQPEMASKADECLLFAIYHFAVFSMTEEECVTNFGQSQASLRQRYHYATRQALVNASFLTTTEMPILQALVLFLLPCRYFYNPHVYWILTGVAMRIAQRMGLHRDGEKLGLPPFEVQMKRRLFYQLVPLDGISSQMSGTGICVSSDTWDTEQPLNVNDDQIWPGMTEPPKEQKAATEMIFCLARSCIGQVFARAGRSTETAGSGQLKDYKELDLVINETEREAEEKYIRYCDIVNPLHFLTILCARSAITAMRIRIRLPKVRDQSVTDVERRELLQLSQKIMDTDATAYENKTLKKYRWHMRSFFMWGSWDSLIFVLTSLWKSDLLSPAETDAAWCRVEHTYRNHSELLELMQALHMAVRRLTLKAWEVNPPSSSAGLESTFISTLRSQQKVNMDPADGRDGSGTTLGTGSDTISPTVFSPTNDVNALFDSLSGGMDLDKSGDFNLDAVDWNLWDQLIQDNKAQSGPQ